MPIEKYQIGCWNEEFTIQYNSKHIHVYHIEKSCNGLILQQMIQYQVVFDIIPFICSGTLANEASVRGYVLVQDKSLFRLTIGHVFSVF